MVAGHRAVLSRFGTEMGRWVHEAADVRAAGLPERAIALLTAGGHTYEHDGALWFRSTALGDDKDRVLRKSDGELTYFAVDIGFHHFVKFAARDAHVIEFFGPDHHGYIGRLRAAMRALGHPDEAFDVLIVQLVTLLRDGQPVRMSKRRGEFVLMEELLEEVGRDAARFTFLTRRHDSPLDFDLAVATRQTADNPVYYVQYAHARVASLFRTAAQQGVEIPPWDQVDLAPLVLPEESALIKRVIQFTEVLMGAARAREPHRLAFYLTRAGGRVSPILQSAPDHHRGSPADPGPSRPRRRGGPGDTERPRAPRRVRARRACNAREHVTPESMSRPRACHAREHVTMEEIVGP